jgi:hypothetical protein
MSAFTAEERALIAAIKERKAARERWKADLKSLFTTLNSHQLRPTTMLMSEADYEDIKKWEG